MAECNCAFLRDDKIDVAKQLVDFDHNSVHDIIGLCSGRLTKPY